MGLTSVSLYENDIRDVIIAATSASTADVSRIVIIIKVSRPFLHLKMMSGTSIIERTPL